MNRPAALSCTLGLLLASASPGQVAPARRDAPNIILILADDLGAVDAGCYGGTVQTPAIDSLARDGVRLTRCYAPAPICSPSRAAMLTGRYPVNAGVVGNVSDAPGTEGMPTSQTTMAEVFRAGGYATAHIGKWHLGHTEATDPLGQGFDTSFGHMGGCIDNWSHFFYWNGPNRHDLWRNRAEVFENGRFFPDLMVEEALAFMKEAETPFFCYFAMNTPHYPYQGDADLVADAGGPRDARGLYAAFVTTMDRRIGRLVEGLEALELREQTIVVFTSDHGHSVEVRAHGGGGDNGPYRGHKSTLFEGGIRVPAIVSWPGNLPRGEVREGIMHACDWLPTLASLAGVDLPPDLQIDGVDQSDLLRGGMDPDANRTLHWLSGTGDDAQWAVMNGRWKLIGNARPPVDGPELTPQDRRLFLADLAADAGEASNFAQRYPGVVADLAARQRAWFDAVLGAEAPRPVIHDLSSP